MSTQTPNYGLTKPTYPEPADVAVINGNMDIIDGQMYQNAQDIREVDTSVGILQEDVGTKPSGETATLWDKIGILSNPIVESNYNNVFSSIPSGITISSFNLIKLGKIVMLNFTGTFAENLPASAWHELATLNSNYKPYGLFEALVINNANDAALHARYEASGQIRVYLISPARAFKVSNIYIISGT